MTLIIIEAETDEWNDPGIIIARAFGSGMVKRYWINNIQQENEKIIQILESEGDALLEGQ